jgi:heterodisulfide reductase subunit C
MVKFGGKTYELGLIMVYMVKSGDILKFKKMFKDIKLGVKMFSRGKMAIIPPRIKGKAEIKRIFELSKKSG